MKRYSNEKSSKKSPTTTAKVSVDILNMGSEEDIEKHEKELRKELGSKKKTFNWKAVGQLQDFTFRSRREKIGKITGRNAVNDMLEQFPYFEHEKVVRILPF